MVQHVKIVIIIIIAVLYPLLKYATELKWDEKPNYELIKEKLQHLIDVEFDIEEKNDKI